VAAASKLSKAGRISFLATASETATGTATGTMSVPKASKVVRFKTATLALSAGKLTKVTLKLSSKDAAAVRKALRRKSLRAKITLTMKDASGNSGTKKFTLKLSR
jgi:hypothetical protein